ncbi:MAG: glycosyl hydrolase 53 family protein [Prevotella sp.]|nr:glycosyl hydrolase 53 family protein [Prevotella sp.]
MKKLLTSLLLLLAISTASAQDTDMARGADLSWCTEMEADGRTFLDAKGNVADLFAVMKEAGMTAVRLRVWVNPTGHGYGPWCDKADVLAKAQRAKAQGLDLMIDFHYSDFFADPGTQTMPQDWQSLSADEVRQAVVSHTKDVLQALKDEGLEPRWVQVGNETNQGMVWPHGIIDWDKSGSARFTAYAALSNAAYDAVKEVVPAAQVIVHFAGAYNAYTGDCWFFKDFKAAGGKFDVIGLSHYPNTEKWNSTTTGDESNAETAKSVTALAQKFGVPVIIVETGFACNDPATANLAMRDLFSRMSALPQCAGIFYWEPEVDGRWRPAFYAQKGWNAYGMGAFTTYGRPTIALRAFSGTSGDEASLPLLLQVYDKEAKSVLTTLRQSAPGSTVYRGQLDATEPWLNFFVVDAESNTWYGTDPADKTQLSAADGKWNCWIDSEATGLFDVEVDLSTLKWTHALHTGDNGIGLLSPDAALPSSRYDLLGRTATASRHSIIVMKQGAMVRKVMR